MQPFKVLRLFLLALTGVSCATANMPTANQDIAAQLEIWGVANVTELAMAKNGTHPNYHQKNVIQRCKNFNLEASKKGDPNDAKKTINRLFARAECKGLYGAPNGFRCSYIDLSLCFTLTGDTQIVKRQLGRAFESCDAKNCVMDTSTVGKCYGCKHPAQPNATDTWAKFDLDGVLDSDFGFLSCYGRGGFECPDEGDPMPY
ncbi:hypothetical protein JX266_010906 [Neoarthrinium moseri]|nr:hypothetical protein JX266_010906 [Neoarthrinium moseri]